MIPVPCRMRWAGSVRSGRPSGSMVIIVIAVSEACAKSGSAASHFRNLAQLVRYGRNMTEMFQKSDSGTDPKGKGHRTVIPS